MASTGFKTDFNGFAELLGFIDMHLEIKNYSKALKEVAERVESKLDGRMKNIFYTIGAITYYIEGGKFNELDSRDIRLKYKEDYEKFYRDKF